MLCGVVGIFKVFSDTCLLCCHISVITYVEWDEHSAGASKRTEREGESCAALR